VNSVYKSGQGIERFRVWNRVSVGCRSQTNIIYTPSDYTHMGQLIDKVLGRGESRSVEEYQSFDYTNEAMSTETSDGVNCTIYVATIRTNQDLLRAKDVLYSGDAVIASIGNPEGGLSVGNISEELAEAADEVGGDIARKDRDEFIITPPGVTVSRDTIGSF